MYIVWKSARVYQQCIHYTSIMYVCLNIKYWHTASMQLPGCYKADETSVHFWTTPVDPAMYVALEESLSQQSSEQELVGNSCQQQEQPREVGDCSCCCTTPKVAVEKLFSTNLVSILYVQYMYSIYYTCTVCTVCIVHVLYVLYMYCMYIVYILYIQYVYCQEFVQEQSGL